MRLRERSGGDLVQGALDLRLPWQRVNELVQPDRRFQVGKGLAMVIEELQVCDESERIGHRHHARQQPDPVPGNSGGAVLAFVTPQGLTGTRVGFVAEGQDSSTEVGKVQLRRSAGLPQ